MPTYHQRPFSVVYSNIEVVGKRTAQTYNLRGREDEKKEWEGEIGRES